MSLRARRRPAALAALTVLTLAGCSSSSGSDTASSAPTTAAPSVSTAATPAQSTAPPSTPTPTPTATRGSTTAAPRTTAPPRPRTSTPTSTRLPLGLPTGDATRVITVVADRSADTRATVQRWRKSSGGWRKVGSSVSAYVGSDGIGRASESTSRTPAGSFTLTQAFGRDADPGTRLPYLRTTPDDYWISSPGPEYNTEQRCGNCGYDDGVNERLHDVTPEYDHAVVIDYNTRNAPGGVKPGRGSAFFLHIAAGKPTAGCVAIPRRDLVDVLVWLRPADHPRILIGVD